MQSRNQSKVSSQCITSAVSWKMGCSNTLLTDSTVENTSLKSNMTLIRAYHSRKGRCSAFKDSMIHEIALDLQFTSHFAARYVLHRIACQGIQRVHVKFYQQVNNHNKITIYQSAEPFGGDAQRTYNGICCRKMTPREHTTCLVAHSTPGYERWS